MKQLIDTYKKTGSLHHAYVLEGEANTVVEGLKDFLDKSLNIKSFGNPDVTIMMEDTFTIDNSRELKILQSWRAVTGKKIFIIAFRFMGHEAQNALLKTLEEPTEDTHFFIITPKVDILLPTVRSRVIVIADTAGESHVLEAEAKKFIKASVVERLAQVKEMIEEKDKGKAIDFVQAIERILAVKPKDNAAALAQILEVEKYLQDRSSSVKLLLEHLALVI